MQTPRLKPATTCSQSLEKVPCAAQDDLTYHIGIQYMIVRFQQCEITCWSVKCMTSSVSDLVCEGLHQCGNQNMQSTRLFDYQLMHLVKCMTEECVFNFPTRANKQAANVEWENGILRESTPIVQLAR